MKAYTVAFAILALGGAVFAYVQLDPDGYLFGQADSAVGQTPAAAQQKADPGSGKSRKGQTASVKVVTARAGDLPVVRQTIGAVVAQNSTALSSPAAGLVASLKAISRAQVKTGDILLKLDDRAIVATIAKDQAQLSKDSAVLKDASATYDSTQALVSKGVVTTQAGTDAQATVREAQASIDLDKAQIAVDQVTLANTSVQAPFDGQLGVFLVSPGAFVAAGTPIVTLTQMKPLFVEFALPQSDLAAARTALTANTLAAGIGSSVADGSSSDATYPVVFLDNAVDGASGTFKMRALLANDDLNFWPGQTLSVQVELSRVPNLVLLPSVAVQPQADGTACYVVKADNTVEVRKVTVALQVGDEVGISAGLSAGEIVIVEGQGALSNGARVTVAPPDAKATPSAGATPIPGAKAPNSRKSGTTATP